MTPIPAERIESRIYLLRGHKVMLSPDLAELYEDALKRPAQQARGLGQR